MADAPLPGWYPDPSGSGGLRWWDGARWTEHAAPAPASTQAYAQPYAPAGRRPVPEGTPLYTVWIWLVVVLPLIPSLLLFLVRPQVMFRTFGVGDQATVTVDPFALVGGPAYFLIAGIGWLISAAVIVCAWLDYRELTRRGVERPFHWAWSFLGPVYPIGRSVVVRGVAAGRGLAPLWATIVVLVAGFTISIVWSVLLFSQILGTLPDQLPPGT